MAPEPLPHVDPGEFALPKPTCFCGKASDRVFRGWPLCSDCGPRVERRWRLENPKMATGLKTRRR